MKTPFKKSIGNIGIEGGVHNGAGRRQILLSSVDNISENIEAMTKGFLPPGAAYDWHCHDNIDEFFIVLSGQGTVEFEDGTKIDYKEGDLVYKPAPMKHKHINTGDTDSIFYFIRVRN